MAEAGLIPRQERVPGSPSLTARPLLTLAEEHMLLLRQVAARAEKVLSAVAAGRWPGAELAALARYARAEVLRQASDEEALLFPAAPQRDVTRLARDHARLRSAADMLARAAAGEQPMSAGQAAAATRDFAALFERHLRAEDSLLASGRAQRGARPVPLRAARADTSGTCSPRDG